MAEGYMGALLCLDLGRETHWVWELPPGLKELFVGGKGFGAKLLYDLVPAKADPLGPDNALMFLAGPLTGTTAPSMRGCVVTKSPLTGIYLDSFFGGRFGPEIKYAGYDGIIVLGRAEEPVYVSVKDDQVEFRPAGAIWGRDALTANRMIKEELGDPEAKLATIGPAGENMVGPALISCEFNRQAGRGGAGAVMGSKNLKGLALRGSRLVRVHDPARFAAAALQARAEIAASEECAALTEFGTSYAVPWSNEVGTLPHLNFRDQVDDKAGAIGEEGQAKHLFLGKAACLGCPIRCSQMGAVRTGKHAHLITDIVEYESAALMGSNLDIHDIRGLAALVKLCDELGLDSISAGNIIGFAFEACERGLIQPPEGVDLSFGSLAGAEYLVRAMALAETDLGRLLGQGVRRAARELGRGSEDYALHVKGLEIPGWAPRGLPGMGLAYMTADRGACHQRGFMVAYEVGGQEFRGKPVDQFALEGKGLILKGAQDYLAGTDALVKCDFGAFGVKPETYRELLESCTGRTEEPGFLDLLGERIWNQVRLFNLREGLAAKDDRLPPRIVREPLPGGPAKGRFISDEDMDFMLAEYYRARGWDGQGRPLAKTLERLGLSREADHDCGRKTPAG